MADIEYTVDVKPRSEAEGGGFIAVVPFWAVWPFETLVLPRAHDGALSDLAAQPQRDTTPEAAAQQLRNLPED